MMMKYLVILSVAMAMVLSGCASNGYAALMQIVFVRPNQYVVQYLAVGPKVVSRTFQSTVEAFEYATSHSPTSIEFLVCDTSWPTGYELQNDPGSRVLRDYQSKRRSPVPLIATRIGVGSGRCPAAPIVARTEAPPPEIRTDFDLYDRGSYFEKRGRNDSEQYKHALRDYLDSANRVNDVRSYLALSGMYSEGRGTPKDPVEASKWLERARVEYKRANAVCKTKEVYAALQRNVQELENRNAGLNVLSNLLTGADNTIGQIVIVKVYATNLVTMKQRFQCTASGRRINARFDSNEPDYIILRNAYGAEYLFDNRLSSFVGAATDAALTSFLASLPPMPISDVQVVPLDDGHFNVL